MKVEKLLEMQDYLSRIAFSLRCHYADVYSKEDILQEMNTAILERAQEDPTFLDQRPGYISKYAGYIGRDFCKRAFAVKLGWARNEWRSLDEPNRDAPPLAEDYAMAAPAGDQDIAIMVRDAISTLTGRAREVATMMLAGYKRVDIAKHFGLSSQSLSKDVNQVKAVLAPVYAAR